MKVVLSILKFLVEIFPAVVSLVNSTKKKKKDEDTSPTPEHEVVIENPE